MVFHLVLLPISRVTNEVEYPFMFLAIWLCSFQNYMLYYYFFLGTVFILSEYEYKRFTSNAFPIFSFYLLGPLMNILLFLGYNLYKIKCIELMYTTA